MYKILKTAFIAVMVCCCVVQGFAKGGEEATGDVTKLSIFIGEPLADYPEEGTRIGNLIEKGAGVDIEFEMLVGELSTKAGIMLAGGNLPDILNARDEQKKFQDQGYLIPLEDLITEHAPNLYKLYKPYWDRLKAEDGHIYTIPDLAPHGEATYTDAEKGWWIQKRVIEWAGYPKITTLEEYFDVIGRYLEAHPETDGKPNIGFEPLTFSWYKDYLYSATNVLSGYSGEGQGFVDYVDGKWTFSTYFGTDAEEKFYKIFNKAFQKGLVDPEGFVGTLDDYKAKLSAGNVLGIYDETWIFAEAQNILKSEKPDHIYVSFPVTFDGGPDQYHSALSLAVGMGSSITTSCKDPVAAIKFLDFMCREEVQKLIYWGEKDVDYFVNADGRYHRNDEIRDKFKSNDFIQKEFGGEYFFEYFPGMEGTFTDGNSTRTGRQPEEFIAQVTDAEREVLEAYNIKAFYEMYTPPAKGADRTVYQPLWSLKAEQGSDFDIVNTKIQKLRALYCSKLLTAASDSEFLTLWKEYNDGLGEVNLAVYTDFYQTNIDARVRKALNQN